ncbi:MAG TPA: homocysteine S-methyltransferase family protein [Candidatus Limnocylindrales bacterium]|nr:homocysteine S-methyltransferase family protein [Candidatus Limnocylindrales bacterium]
MKVEAFLETGLFGLAEGSIYERLRRHPAITFDPFLAHASLIYDPKAASLLEQVHRGYLDVGQSHALPMFALTDTWRANQERIDHSQFKRASVNQDNARFLIQLRDSYGPQAQPIFVGGNIGPRGDAYNPAEALAPVEAERFHTPQLEALVEGGVDFLYASTLPAFSEAQGIAAAMAKTGRPFWLSFVIRPDGTLLDGTRLEYAIEVLDAGARPPLGYAVNCVHPRVFQAGMRALGKRKAAAVKQIQIYQTNTSEKSPQELDGMEELETVEPETLAELMVQCHQEFGTVFMGGCCGTDTRHIQSLARQHKKLCSGVPGQ